MAGLPEVLVRPLPLARFGELIGEQRYEALEHGAERARAVLAGRTLWNVNSTASGGGVAELLLVLVGYALGAGLDTHWVVTQCDPEFFAITKRIHNRVHGVKGDDGDLGPEEAAHFESVTASNAALLADQVRAGDVVILHDPQTAGLCRPMRELGACVVWRCHIGADRPNDWTRQAWDFLLPRVSSADAFVFSRRQHIPEGLPAGRVEVIPPSIDPFSLKNRVLAPAEVEGIVRHIGLYDGRDRAPVAFARGDGTQGKVERRASIVGEGPLDPSVPLVVQVSRWDRLKDMRGVMLGFARQVVGRVDAHLALVGPDVSGVTDDPEGAEVLQECITALGELPALARASIRLVSLPMADIEENAVMVNALQRASTVVVQKSLAEGFGLTVAEAMWKAKPVVVSDVGGIADQVTPDSGVLLDDPTDLDAFGDALASLLERPADIVRLGTNAHAHVVENFVGDRHLLRYATMLERLLATHPDPRVSEGRSA
jgi:trehalose synthase